MHLGFIEPISASVIARAEGLPKGDNPRFAVTDLPKTLQESPSMLMRRCTVSAAMWIKLLRPLRCSVQRGCEANLRNIIFDAEWVEIIVLSLKWRFDHV